MNNTIEKICNKYQMIDWAATERVRLLQELFDFSDDEIKDLADKKPNLFTCLSGDIVDIDNNLFSKLGFSFDHKKKFMLQYEDFPFISYNAEDIKEKIKTLESLGINKDNIALNFKILQKNKEEIELRTKLAFINQVPVESFIYDKHYLNSQIIWSRMQALKTGVCSFEKIYNNYQFNKNSGYSVEQLIAMFPLDDSAKEEITHLYLEAKKTGSQWKQSYKAQVRFETDPENNFSPNSKPMQKQNTVLKKVYDFVDNNIYEQENRFSAYETEQKLAEYFNAPINEINTILNKNPEILNVNIHRFKYLKAALQKDFKLSDEDLYKIFQAKPSIIQKSVEEFIAYKTFLKDYLLLDSQQIKYIFVNQPSVLSMNPQQIINCTKDIKRCLNVSFKQATSWLLYRPEVFSLTTEQIEKNVETYTSLGIDKSEIFAHIAGLLVDPTDADIKLMLSRINGHQDEDFLKFNYAKDADQVYARTMFNLQNDIVIPIYRSEKFFARSLKHFYHADKTSYFDNEKQVMARLLELYPLNDKEKEEIKKLYHSMHKENCNLENNSTLGGNE